MLGSFLTREHNHASTSVISSFHISRSDGLDFHFLAASIVTLNDLVTLEDTQIMTKVIMNTRTAVRDDTSSVPLTMRATIACWFPVSPRYEHHADPCTELTITPIVSVFSTGSAALVATRTTFVYCQAMRAGDAHTNCHAPPLPSCSRCIVSPQVFCLHAFFDGRVAISIFIRTSRAFRRRGYDATSSFAYAWYEKFASHHSNDAFKVFAMRNCIG